jgi:hypothetical protein
MLLVTIPVVETSAVNAGRHDEVKVSDQRAGKEGRSYGTWYCWMRASTARRGHGS